MKIQHFIKKFWIDQKKSYNFYETYFLLKDWNLFLLEKS